MSINVVPGDLFKTGLKIFAHGCNSKGVMGGGIAAEFQRRYPHLYASYHSLCHQRLLKVGSFYMYEDADVQVFNLITQERPGPDATLANIEVSVHNMCSYVYDNTRRGEVSVIGLPKIGAVIGGLEWSSVVKNLEYAVEDYTKRVHLTVYTID